MRTILLTIEGPQRSVDLEVPGEIPVSELIPLLLDICRPIQSASPVNPSMWGLGPKHNDQPLAVTHTLIDSRVMDGSILVLLDMVSWASQRERKANWLPQTLSPSRSLGGFGVTWDTDGLLPSSQSNHS